jgi:hypothetical protein
MENPRGTSRDTPTKSKLDSVMVRVVIVILTYKTKNELDAIWSGDNENETSISEDRQYSFNPNKDIDKIQSGSPKSTPNRPIPPNITLTSYPVTPIARSSSIPKNISGSPATSRADLKMSDLKGQQGVSSTRPKPEELLAKEETFMQIDLLEQVAKELRDSKVIAGPTAFDIHKD